jgi:uncharacterized protein (UPF0303 family)
LPAAFHLSATKRIIVTLPAIADTGKITVPVNNLQLVFYASLNPSCADNENHLQRECEPI